MKSFRWLAVFPLLVVGVVHAGPREEARDVLRRAGVAGGLVVHLGCGEGRMTEHLRAGPGYLVQGLDRDSAQVRRARERLVAEGIYGPVSVDVWPGGPLPFIDDSVNLFVVELDAVPEESELMRALAPGGVALLRVGSQPMIVRKPRPENIDDWTHYLYDASNNPVSHDMVVGPPRHLQWTGSPAWTRHHDHMSSFNAMVSAGGRVFYIVDEAPRAEVQLPPRWRLVARDAFNGVVLWKRDLKSWQPHLWPAKSGPAQLPRRLTAVRDRVYVTLGIDAPLSALDAKTGATVHEYTQTHATEEVLFAGEQLLALVNPRPGVHPWATRSQYTTLNELRAEPGTWVWKGEPRRLVAIAPDTGRTRWAVTTPVIPLTLAAWGGRVFFHDGQRIVCLDADSGQRRWTSQPVARAKQIFSWFAPRLAVADGVVVFADGEKMVRHHGANDEMIALDAAGGRVLWKAKHPPSGYDSPEDIFIVDGVVWTAPTTNRRDSGQFTGRDLKTGKVVATVDSDCGDHMPHHRCHPAKATERFLLMSRTGIEYVDLKKKHWDRNDWVRGACLYGIVAANGLTYAPPHSCACYVVAKLNGLNAVAPESPGRRLPAKPAVGRLERGPAFDTALAPAASSTGDWPTYRGDNARSGATKTPVSSPAGLQWERRLGGRLTPPVIAAGLVLVAQVDRHCLQALDQATGAPRWSFIAGSRIDSPPTVWRGRVIFGCADGHIYALRARDGALVWRFRAAPLDRRLVAYDQLESPWPVSGSVLIVEGVVHAVAGRSRFLDGGMRLIRLDAASGRLLSETVLDDRDPKTGKPIDANVKWPNMPVSLPDVLSCDGKYVCMRSQRFDLQGRALEVTAPTNFKDQSGDGAHLFSPTGFLDDSWWHRTYWIYGKTPTSGAGGWYLPAYCAPTGRIMVCEKDRVYAFNRLPRYFPRATALEYHYYAAKKAPRLVSLRGKPAAGSGRKSSRKRPAPTRPEFDWTWQAPVLARAMTLAGQTIWSAGPPDLVDEELTQVEFASQTTAQRLAEQRAAYEGRKGGYLLALAADDGHFLAAYRLDSIPVFDGLAAAGGSLFLVTIDGRVLRLGAGGRELEPAALELKPSAIGLTPAVSASHPDFDFVAGTLVTRTELGWRLRTPGGQVGVALRKLAQPVTSAATFRLRMMMIPNPAKSPNARPPGNAFLAFGEDADSAHLVYCGLRSAGGRCMIVQGPLNGGALVSKSVEPKLNQPFEVTVTVDLKKQQVAMELLGQTAAAKLKKPLQAIRYAGYACNSVAAEFSAVETARR